MKFKGLSRFEVEFAMVPQNRKNIPCRWVESGGALKLELCGYNEMNMILQPGMDIEEIKDIAKESYRTYMWR